MPQAAKARPHVRLPHVTLNSDGRRHPVENTLTAFTLVAGLLAFATGWIVTQHMVATALGAASLVVGLYSQLVSATREQRMLIVTGLVAGFVGVALGLAHGGFAP
jgi:FtsH-binding integral membrane protein